MGLGMGGMAMAVLSIMSIQAEECNDRDWDNVQDTQDNCFQQYNPQRLESHADGHGDACDTETTNYGGKFAD